MVLLKVNFIHFLNIYSKVRHSILHNLCYKDECKDSRSLKWIIVMQYANSGTLGDYLHDKKNFEQLSMIDKLQLAIGIGKGLAYIHAQKIIHRDLKSNNILVHNKQALISDFGLSKHMDTLSSNRNDYQVGHFVYTDPDTFRKPKLRNRSQSDIYSYGVILWEITRYLYYVTSYLLKIYKII